MLDDDRESFIALDGVAHDRRAGHADETAENAIVASRHAVLVSTLAISPSLRH